MIHAACLPIAPICRFPHGCKAQFTAQLHAVIIVEGVLLLGAASSSRRPAPFATTLGCAAEFAAFGRVLRGGTVVFVS